MARYEITAPNGERYEITAPDSATEAQVLEYARKQFEPKAGMVGRADFPPGYMHPADQRIATNIENPPPGEIVTPVPPGARTAPPVQTVVPGAAPAPAVSPAPPQNEIPNSGPSQAEQNKAKYAQIQEQIAAAEGRMRELQSLGLDEDAAAEAEYINKLKSQLPPDWAGRLGTAGNVVGAVAGAVGGVPGSVIGGMLGGVLGTTLGGLFDAKRERMTEEEKVEYLKSRNIESVAFDAVGNLVFFGGGKILRVLVKDNPVTDEVIKKLGGAIKREPLRIDASKVVPGERVFSTAGMDEAQRAAAEASLQRAAAEGGAMLTTAQSAATKGQLTGGPGLLESASRQARPEVFAAAERAQKGALEAEIETARKALVGEAQEEFPGAALRRTLDAAEERVKDVFRPVWEKMAASTDVKLVDFAPVRALAAQILNRDAKQSVKTLDAAQRKLLLSIANGSSKISPAEAHNIQSTFFAKARDLEQAASPDSRLKGLYDQFASLTRGALDSAMERAVAAGQMRPEDLALVKEARAVYKEMNERLYDPTLRAAHRDIADEKVAGAIVKPGDVQSVRALEQLVDFAKKLDNLGAKIPGQAAPAPGKAAVSAERGLTVPGAPVIRPATAVPALEGPQGQLSRFVRRAEATAAGKADDAFAADYGVPGGRPLADSAREALAGVRAEFFQRYAGTPEALANLHRQMGNPLVKRTFETLFPAHDAAARQSIERLSQAAQILYRTGTASTGGAQGLVGAAGGAVGASVSPGTGRVANVAARLLGLLTTRGMARSFTEPALKADLPKNTAWILAALKGTAGNTVPESVSAMLRALDTEDEFADR